MLSPRFYFPVDIAQDLDATNLPSKVKAEVFACAWEYTRCIIPQYTNWSRYVAFLRIIVIGIVAEFDGSLVDVAADNNVLGYDLDKVLSQIFGGTVTHQAMAREYKTFLLVTSEKTTERRNGELFRRYVNTISSSPANWFRLRDCDALARFSIAAALACNDMDDVWFSECELTILTEIADMMYDAIAFFKHRSEGETNSTFAYMPEDLRTEAYRTGRDLLWALDVACAHKPAYLLAINFARFFGGPLHMMMQRYRFVEDGCRIGMVEDEEVVQEAREHVKLWNRLDADEIGGACSDHWQMMLNRQQELTFDQFASMLQAHGDGNCWDCQYRSSYGASSALQFGGVRLCQACRELWRIHLSTLPQRAQEAFPLLRLEPLL